MSSNFSRLPSVSITRSKFIRKSQHKTSLKLGELTPILLDEVLPGDTRSIDLGALVRMSTPVAPVMDNIWLDFYAFFVPNRLVWTHWKEFMGENNSSAGIYSGTEYVIPMSNIYATGVGIGSLGDHFGLPVVSYDSSKRLDASVLPVRGYRRIYNRFFRDQNVIAPLTVSTGDIYTSGDSYNASLLKVAKVSDYFTRALPYAQKGAPVTIPLGTTAPVIAASDLHDMGGYTKFGYIQGGVTYDQSAFGLQQGDTSTSGVRGLGFGGSVGANDADITRSNLVTDLSTATAATINQLRFAFQYQKLLEKDALYGTRLITR